MIRYAFETEWQVVEILYFYLELQILHRLGARQLQPCNEVK